MTNYYFSVIFGGFLNFVGFFDSILVRFVISREICVILIIIIKNEKVTKIKDMLLEMSLKIMLNYYFFDKFRDF